MLNKENLQDLYPLSPMQEGMLFHSLLDNRSEAYLEQLSYRLAGDLDVDVFRRAWETLVARNDVLRTVFSHEKTRRPLQIVLKQRPLEHRFTDLSDLGEREQEALLSAFLRDDRRRSFDLSRGVLSRVAIFRIGPRRYEVVWTFHHILLDGWSVGLLLDQLMQLYGQLRAGTPLALPSSRPYREYIKWLEAQDATASLRFWAGHLEGYDGVARIPEAHRAAADEPYRPEEHRLLLDRPTTQALATMASRAKVTLNTVVQTLWAIVLGRHCDRRDVVLGMVTSGRPPELPGIDTMVGLFINVVPLRIRFEPEDRFSDLLCRVQREMLDSEPHRHVRLADIPGCAAMIDHLIAFESYPLAERLDAAMAQGTYDLKVEKIRSFEQSHYGMNVVVTPGERLELAFLYDASTRHRGQIERLAAQIEATVAAVLQDPQVRVDAIDILPAAERRALLPNVKAPPIRPEADVTIVALFEARAAESPRRTAVVARDARLSYAELNQRAEALVGILARDARVQRGDRVGVLLERSAWLAVCFLGLLKSGAVYVPIDPTFPVARVEHMLRDASCVAVLGTAAYLDRLTLASGTLPIDVDQLDLASAPAGPVRLAPRPEDIAYAIYTSGSSGTPKGVQIAHRSLANVIAHQRSFLRIDPDTCWLQCASPSFDGSILELTGALAHGASLVVVDRETVADPRVFGAVLRRQTNAVIVLPPSYIRSLSLDDLAAIRVVITGGEPADVGVATALARRTRCVNGYGPSETTILVTCHEVDGSRDYGASIPLGAPIAGVEILILDSQNRLAPIGVPGEICIAGVCLGRGYIDRPELNAAKFRAHPFRPAELIYRSGDIGCARPDGEIDYFGRDDNQVKVRGFRVELGEVQTALAAHPAVREACVITRRTAHGPEIGAYLVADRPLDAGELGAHLLVRLPEYMIPGYFVQLDRLPINALGKVDIKALPGPEARALTSDAGFVAPRDALEERLCEIWREALGRDRVGIHDGFFEAGGQSLKAIRIVAQIHQLLDLELSLREFFAAPTIAETAARLRPRGRAKEVEPIARIPDAAHHALSPTQRRLWVLDRLDPGAAAYNIGGALLLEGALDPRALERAFAELSARHESLRTTFTLIEGEPRQQVHAPTPILFPVVDLSGASEPLERARALAEEAVAQPFDLEAGPLLRLQVFTLDERRHVLVYVLHHIIGDGWAVRVIVEELSAIYAVFCGGEQRALPPPVIQARDHAAWLNRWLTSPGAAADRAFWLDRLQGSIPALDLPTDRPRPSLLGFEGRSIRRALGRPLDEAVARFARSSGATPFMVLVSAVNVLLHRLTGQEDILVGHPVAARADAEAQRLVGALVNTLVLRNQVRAEWSFSQLLEHVKQTTIAALEHQSYPFDRLIEELNLPRDLAKSALFNVMVVLEDEQLKPPALPGVTVTTLPLATRTTKFDLMFSFGEVDGAYEMVVDHSVRLFDEARIERMITHFCVLFEAAATAPHRPIAALPILTEEERRTLTAWGESTEAYPPGACIHERVEAQARRQPDAVAVTFEAERVMYAELDQRSNQLAHLLRARGVGPEVLVGVCLDRSIEMIVALLGILKAGGAYVPLDPSYPLERLEMMLDDARVAVVVTVDALVTRIAAHGGVIVRLDADRGLLDREPRDSLRRLARPEDLAYVIYTSGSTGKPKGVMVTHDNVVRLFDATDAWYHFDASDVWTMFHSYAFDFSVWEIWGALFHGGRVVIVPYWVSRAPDAFYKLLGDEGVTVLNQTPSAFRQLIRAEESAGEEAFSRLRLRHVIFGGEPLDLGALRPWWDRHGDTTPRLVNMYGITETTVHDTYRALDRRDLERPWSSVIGRQIPDLRMYILDPRQALVPVGVYGELYFGGPCVARGYLNRPELTAERFSKDPFHPGEDARLYRTGDLARWLPSGEVEFLGRVDQQVKIRGHRVELGEIEAALAQHPAIREVAAVVREDSSAEKALVAYLVSDHGAAPSAVELQAFLREKLPEIMIPSAFVTLDALPLSPSGKLDRRALPAPAVERTAAETTFVAPRDRVEERLAALWESVLGVPAVGVHDGFFELGGHSLKAVRLAFRIQESFAIAIPLHAVFERSTIAAQAELIRAGGKEAPPIDPAPRSAEMPTSAAQRRLWFIEQLEGPNATYNVPFGFSIRGLLDVGALHAALAEIVRRHELLRTTFVDVDGRPAQRVGYPLAPALPMIDLSALDEAGRAAALCSSASEEAERPFDLAAGPLFRASLLRLARDHHALLLNMHHIVTDGWSLRVMTEELGALYGAFQRGEPSPLPELAIQYADFAVWQNAYLASEALSAQLAYWKRKLAGPLPTFELPPRRDPGRESPRGATEAFELPPDLVGALARLGRERGATLFMTLLAAFAVLLSRYGGKDDIIIGTPISNRGQRALEPMIGFFVNTLALRVDLSGDPSFPELLSRVRRVALEAYENQDLPFERVVEEIDPERSLDRTPLFQVMFMLHDEPGPRQELPGIEVEMLDIERRTAHFPLLLSLAPAGGAGETGALSGQLGYRTDLVDASTVRRMITHLRALLSAIAQGAVGPSSHLPMLSADERHAILVAWNDTASPRSQRGCLPELFDQQAKETPDAEALRFGDRSMTYRALEERANRLSHHLRALGVGPEVLVGLFVPRSMDLAVGVLAILKAGGAYVPLDPSYPPARTAFMIEDSGLAAVLTWSAQAAALQALDMPVIALDQLDLGAHPATAPESGLTPDHQAYVIYTSGSTGRPKGVAMPHAPLVNLILWNLEQPGFRPRARTLQFASASFDVSIQEMFTTWASGGVLVVANEGDRRDLVALLDLIETERIERLFLPFAALSRLAEIVDERARAPESLREIITAGEQLRITPAVARLFQRLPGCTLDNHYGPSETHVATAHRLTGEVESWPVLPPIGRPIANASAYVLDSSTQIVPPGVVGELYLGGAVLARGYLGRADLTAQRFIPHPFDDRPGARLYRTGDLAQQMDDGTLLYRGRIDNQVKIRGFRVEPEEVEACLSEHPGVLHAAVRVVEGPQSEKRLVAYVVPAKAQAPAEQDLRAYLGTRLPDYMTPFAVVLLERMPMTPSGKIDRKSLPAPDQGRVGMKSAAPRTATELVLAGMWAELLGHGGAGVADDFFALGGHSLLATQLLSRVRSSFGVDLSLRRLFEMPTIEAFAAAIDGARSPSRGGDERRIEPLGPDDDRPLSFAQERLWMLDRLEDGRSAAYNMAASLRLLGALDRDALATSVSALIERHEILGSRVVIRDGAPLLETRGGPSFELTITDLRRASPGERSREIARRIDEEASRPFDLKRGPLLRAALIQSDEAEHVLLLTLHHIVSDGWSMGILVREIGSLYEAHLRGAPASLPALPIQYADYASWQRAWMSHDVLQRQLAFWTDHLASAPAVIDLPLDHPRQVVQSAAGGVVSFAIDTELTERLRALGLRCGATLFMTLMAAFAALLSRHSRQTDIVIGTPIANRNRREVEGLIGLFANILPLRIDLSGDPSTEQLIEQVRGAALGAYAHQDLPFEQLVAALNPARDLAHTPVFQVLFVLQNTPLAPLSLTGLEISPIPRTAAAARFDLTLSLEETAGGLQGAFEYRTDLFGEARIRRMTGHFRCLLKAMVSTPKRPALEPSILAPEELAQLAVWSSGARAEIDRGSVLDQLEARVAATPDAMALLFEEQRIGYAELHRRANQLARRLQTLGVGPESIVAVCLPPSVELIVAFLGILKAGGAYLPLDPDHPLERRSHVMNDAGARLLLSQTDLSPALEGDAVKRVCLDLEWPEIAALDGARLSQQIEPGNLAYVIYTSGSTGTPKGVMIEHRGLPNLVTAQLEAFDVRPDDVVLQFASPSFDASISEILVTLSAGATLVLTPKLARLPGPAFLELLRSRGVTSVTLPPTMLATFSPSEAPSLRVVVSAGEALGAEVAERWAGSCRLINAYGPTEATVCATTDLVQPGDSAPSIGRPIQNTHAHILGPHGQQLPIGVAGELHLASVSLARGYLGRPELTAASFIDDPMRHGGRLYRTGDLACVLPDGRIRLLGRLDDQIKLRGFRIEPGEIEAQLAASPEVREAAVVLRKDGEGDERLVAYVAHHAGAAPSVRGLREYLHARLPEYMIPSEFVVVSELPKTPSRKIDRAALPALSPRASRRETTRVPPRDDIELRLLQIWEGVLGVAEIGMLDGFFDHGGHSMRAVSLAARIEKAFGHRIPLGTLFQASTIEAQASLLRSSAITARWSPLVPLQPSGDGAPVFLVHPAGGNVLCYAALARALGPGQPVYGLQQRGVEDDGQTPRATVAEMAQEYLSALDEIQPEGPVRLAGWSFGGLVAYEMAKRLWAERRRDSRLVLIDACNPSILPETTRHLDETDQLQSLFSGALELPTAELRAMTSEERLGVVLERATAANLVLPDFGMRRARRMLDLFIGNGDAVHRYSPEHHSRPTLVVRATVGALVRHEDHPTLGWGNLAQGALTTADLHCSHEDVVRTPHVAELASLLKSWFVL